MSYTKKIGDKEYEFASEKAYDTYYKLATSAAKQNGITIREALEGNYQKYVDANSPLLGKSATPTTPTTPQVSTPTYSAANYYNNIIANAGNQKQNAYSYAEAIRKYSEDMAAKERAQAEALAEIGRKRAIVDSSTVAEQQKATYGANAEQLGRMGLNVSGYSDYLNSQAYATGMAGRQQANANATIAYQKAADTEWAARNKAMYTEQLAKLEADKGYYDTVASIEGVKYSDYKEQEARLYAEQQQKEAQQQTNYQNFMKLAIENGWSADQIKALAPSFSISTEEATKVANTNKALYGDNVETEEPPTAQDSGYTTISAINDGYHNLTIDSATRDKYIADLNSNGKSQVQTFIAEGDLAGGNARADELFAANNIDEQTYQVIKTDLATINIGNIEKIDEVKTIGEDLEELKKTKQISDTQYETLNKMLEEKAKSFFAEVDMSGIKVSFVNKVAKNYDANISVDGNVYEVGTISVSEADVKHALRTINTTADNIVGYNNTYYLYNSNKDKWEKIVSIKLEGHQADSAVSKLYDILQKRRK